VVNEPAAIIEPAGAHWDNESGLRAMDNPIAWIGQDRLLCDDISRCGLRRRVIARRDEMPQQMEHLLQAYRLAGGAKVSWWMHLKEGVWYLWIVWKEG
jgi:hypothetical protein